MNNLYNLSHDNLTQTTPPPWMCNQVPGASYDLIRSMITELRFFFGPPIVKINWDFSVVYVGTVYSSRFVLRCVAHVPTRTSSNARVSGGPHVRPPCCTMGNLGQSGGLTNSRKNRQAPYFKSTLRYYIFCSDAQSVISASICQEIWPNFSFGGTNLTTSQKKWQLSKNLVFFHDVFTASHNFELFKSEFAIITVKYYLVLKFENFNWYLSQQSFFLVQPFLPT